MVGEFFKISTYGPFLYESFHVLENLSKSRNGLDGGFSFKVLKDHLTMSQIMLYIKILIRIYIAINLRDSCLNEHC